MNPSPAALAAAEEVSNIFQLVERLQIAAIIDRHMAKPSHDGKRYFSDGEDVWIWNGSNLRIKGLRFPSVFTDPEDLLSCVDAYETDEDGNRLDKQEGGEG